MVTVLYYFEMWSTILIIKMDQASHIWKMLDDMAASDPEAYKKFVE